MEKFDTGNTFACQLFMAILIWLHIEHTLLNKIVRNNYLDAQWTKINKMRVVAKQQEYSNRKSGKTGAQKSRLTFCNWLKIVIKWFFPDDISKSCLSSTSKMLLMRTNANLGTAREVLVILSVLSLLSSVRTNLGD